MWLFVITTWLSVIMPLLFTLKLREGEEERFLCLKCLNLACVSVPSSVFHLPVLMLMAQRFMRGSDNNPNPRNNNIRC